MQASGIIPRLIALYDGGKTVLVAIDGPGGSGKSFLAQSISTALTASGTPASVVQVDDFFLPSGQRPIGSVSEKPIGGDFDWPRLRNEVLDPLRRGEPARYDRYDWDRDALVGIREASAGRVVIVEGIYSSRRELASFYDLRVWVDCPRELRLTRGLQRDGEAARRKWEQDWMPSEDRYIREHQPQEYAHVVVNGAAV